MLNAIRAWIISLFYTKEEPVVEPCSDYTGEPVSIYTIIEDAVVETAEEDVLSWEQSLRAKYGINNAMEM